jgi:hypothetical protein
MGLNEQYNETNPELKDCDTKLTDAGYRVIDPEELKTRKSTCGDKTSFGCPKQVLGGKNQAYNINKIGHSCYISIKSSKVGYKGMPSKTYVLYEDGVFLVIGTFSENPKLPTDDNNKEYMQYHYQGNWVCENGNIKYENLQYKGVYEKDNFNKLIKSNLEIELSNGSKINANQLIKDESKVIF